MEKTVKASCFVFEAGDPASKNLINVNERTAMSKELMTPEEFGKAFLMDRVLNKNTRDAMAKADVSRNSGMSRE